MADREQEIRLHHEKWKRWKMDIKNDSEKIKQIK